jgi:hypothetical protein
LTFALLVSARLSLNIDLIDTMIVSILSLDRSIDRSDSSLFVCLLLACRFFFQLTSSFLLVGIGFVVAVAVGLKTLPSVSSG